MWLFRASDREVGGLQSASSKLTKPNDLFIECHMGGAFDI